MGPPFDVLFLRPASAQASDGVSQFAQRVMDGGDDPDQPRRDPPTISGILDDVPLLPLADALAALGNFPYRQYANGQVQQRRVDPIAIQKEGKACLVLAKRAVKKNPAMGDPQQVASIRMYTMNVMYRVVNSALRDRRRTEETLRALLPFLKLLITGLRALPEAYRFVGTVYRGQRGVPPDFADQYAADSDAVLWGFTSTTTSEAVLQNAQFCGASGDRVVFKYHVQTMAYSIQELSDFPEESEVVLEPMCYFVISSVINFEDMSGVLQHVGISGSFKGLRMVEGVQDVESSEALCL